MRITRSCSLPLVLAAALSLAPALAHAQTPAADEAAAVAVVERMFEGMRTADSAMVRATFAPGARFAMLDTRSTPAVIRYEPVDGWLRAIAGSNKRWDERIYDVQVRVDGAVRHCGVNAVELSRGADGWLVTQMSDSRRREGCPNPLAK